MRYYNLANFGQIYDKLVILDDFSRRCDKCKNAIHRVFLEACHHYYNDSN